MQHPLPNLARVLLATPLTFMMMGMVPCGYVPTYDVEVMRLTSDCAGEVLATVVIDPDPRSGSIKLEPQSDLDRGTDAIVQMNIDEHRKATFSFASGVTCWLSLHNNDTTRYHPDEGLETTACTLELEHVGWRMPTFDDGSETPQVICPYGYFEDIPIPETLKE